MRGWDTRRTLILLAILTTISGIAFGLLANARRLGRIVSSQELDAVLELPMDPLVHLLLRRIDTALLGDLVFGVLLFLAAARPRLEQVGVYLVVSACGTVVFVSVLVLLGSLAFWTEGRGQQADVAIQVLYVVSQYPIDFFGGLTRVMLFTVVPAAFVTGLPARLITDFRWGTILALGSVALTLAVLAWLCFHAGLRRYRSGAAWT